MENATPPDPLCVTDLVWQVHAPKLPENEPINPLPQKLSSFETMFVQTTALMSVDVLGLNAAHASSLSTNLSRINSHAASSPQAGLASQQESKSEGNVCIEPVHTRLFSVREVSVVYVHPVLSYYAENDKVNSFFVFQCESH